MNILVSGGAGFIGSHLIDGLLETGNLVICADKMIFNSFSNIAFHKSNAHFIFENIEIADQNQVDNLFNKYHFDAVYHLAANSDIERGGKDPDIDFNDTFLTTRCILEAMRKNKVKKLFFASTSAVYGEKPNEVLSEETGGIMPVSYYGGAKLGSEALISAYASMCDMSTVVFRFPNVIGPRLTHGVIFDFIKKLKKDPMELEILGDGKQCKPYLYVMDLKEAILHLTNEWSPGELVYNISVLGNGTTVTRIAEIVTEEMKLPNVSFHYTGGSRGWKGDVPKFQYDISKILGTGWRPQFTSDEAVRKTVEDVL